MTYSQKTKPYTHQAELFERTRELESYALFWEMGVGKTKPIIDTIGHLFAAGKINGALVIAPKAVAPNWVHDELPLHMGAPYKVFLWNTDKANNKGYQQQLADFLLTPDDRLAILVMSFPSVMTERRPGTKAGVKKGREAAKAFLTGRSCLFALDESARIKNPNTKTAKRVKAAGKYADYRRIATGTPVTNSPFDVYSQLQFLDPDVWKRIGCNSFAAFKVNFGVWIDHVRNDTGQAFKQLVDYQNLQTLHKIVDTMGDRLLLEDTVDLPPKNYHRLTFDMSPPQRVLYEKLRDECMVWLDSGDMITAPLAITRMLRLQQVTSGYCPTDDGNMILIEPNPRLDLLTEKIIDCPHQAIIWHKFQKDGDLIEDMLNRERKSFVLYDGRTSQDHREEARAAFKAGDAQFFVANPAAAGEGLTLVAGKSAFFYNTTYKLAERLQAEGRNYRIGQDCPVNYYDLVARASIDPQILRALRTKVNLANQVTGDRLREWIQ